MAISNISFKATEAGNGPSTEAALEMKAKLEVALKQVEEAEGYSSFFTIGQKSELEYSKAILMEKLTDVEHYLKTGEWLPLNSSLNPTQQQSLIDMNSLEEGFWLLNPGETVPIKLTDVDGDMFVENNKVSDGQGGFKKPKVWYVAGEDVIEIKGRNVGKDIELEITHADGTVETKLFKNGATGDYQLCINGLKSKHDILIDMSNVAIIDPATGKKSGMVIIGGRGNDTIYGTLGTDNISGAGGDDSIVGMGGGDSIYGYASTDPFVNVAGTYSAADLGTDGNDNIYDIYGTDIIDAGPGAQDVVHRGYTTNITSQPAQREEGGEPMFDPDPPSDIESWFADSTGWEINADGENELVLTKKAGETDPKVIMDLLGAGEEGYMVSGQRDGTTNDLILTAVKVEGGEPRYYRVRVRDYFSSDSGLTINNSVTDLGELNKDLDGVGTKAVTLNGTGTEGDILVAPKTVFDDFAVEIENLGQSTYDQSQLEDMLKLQKEDPTSIWKDVTIKHSEENGYYIELNASGASGTVIDIPTELGGAAFVQKDGNTWTITVASNSSYSSERVVIKLTNVPAGATIKLGGSTQNVYTTDKNATGVTINTEGGTDLAAGYRFGTNFGDASSDEKIETKFKLDSHGKGASTAQTVGQLKDKINACTTFDLLDEYQDMVDKYSSSNPEKANLQTEVNNKRRELILTMINGSTLTNMKSEMDKATGIDKDTKKKALEDAIKEVTAQIDELKKHNGSYADLTPSWEAKLTALGYKSNGTPVA